MHYFDILFAGLGLVFFIGGFRRGLIGEIVRLAGVIVAFALALSWYSRVYMYASEWIQISPHTLTALSFIGVFIAVLCLVLAAGWFLRRLVRETVFGGIDRIFGGILGVLKIAVIAWVFVASVHASPFSGTKESLSNSRVYSLLKRIGPGLKVPHIAIPRDAVRDRIGGISEKIRTGISSRSRDTVIFHKDSASKP